MSTTTFPLSGIDGTNPLGFLAALGAFRVAAKIAAQNTPAAPVRLAWANTNGPWHPVLHTTAFADTAALLDALQEALSHPNPALSIAEHDEHGTAQTANNPKIPAPDFRIAALEAREKWLDASAPEFADFLAALGNESIIDKNGLNEDTAFRTMSGAGHQHFLKFMRELVSGTTREHIREALFGPWQYRDHQFSMRWDPSDDRRYALRWGNPSGDPATNVRGANRLAIEGLPFLPVMPTASTTLDTTGFSKQKTTERRHGLFWTWPLWTPPLTPDVCRSLLAHTELQTARPAIEKLAPLGIATAYRTQRITTGKFRNFTPAKPIAQ